MITERRIVSVYTKRDQLMLDKQSTPGLTITGLDGQLYVGLENSKCIIFNITIDMIEKS